MTIASIVTRGFFDGINELPTRGFLPGAGVDANAAVPNVKIVLRDEKHHPASYSYVRYIEEKKEELQQVENKIAVAEKAKEDYNKLLAASRREKKRQAFLRLKALEAKAQEEIRSLFTEKARLMRLIQEEEETLIVLYSLPFMT